MLSELNYFESMRLLFLNPILLIKAWIKISLLHIESVSCSQFSISAPWRPSMGPVYRDARQRPDIGLLTGITLTSYYVAKSLRLT